MVKKITIVPVNTLPIEEATPQVETEITPPIVEEEIIKVEPEIVEIKEEINKVDETEIKPEKIKKLKKKC